MSLQNQIRQAALELGFVRVGFAPVTPLPHGRFFQSWVDQGFAAEMSYLKQTAAIRFMPQHLLAGARSAIVVLSSYEGTNLNPQDDDTRSSLQRGHIARYARGQDYHRVVKKRLAQLVDYLPRLARKPVSSTLCVDTGPLLERELAVAAGLGFLGKNTMLITPRLGSYTVIGVAVVDLELPFDSPLPPRCGKCTLCLEACPSGALRKPYLLDANRCISYLTIEHRHLIPDPLKSRMGTWLFGCDICQQICPYNAKAGRRGFSDPELAPPGSSLTIDLEDLLALRSGAYRRLCRGRALRRASRPMLIRNAALAAGNLQNKSAAIIQALESISNYHRDEVRDAARWALLIAGLD